MTLLNRNIQLWNFKGGDWNGKLVVLDIEESGTQICEKLLFLLDEDQRQEFIQVILQSKHNCVLTDCPHFFSHSEKEVVYFPEVKNEPLSICLEQRIVTVHGQMVELTVKEFDILALLIRHPKRVFTYEMITEMVWQEEYASYSRKAINNHVSNLRQKLKISPDSPDYIKSVYGIGYKFDP